MLNKTKKIYIYIKWLVFMEKLLSCHIMLEAAHRWMYRFIYQVRFTTEDNNKKKKCVILFKKIKNRVNFSIAFLSRTYQNIVCPCILKAKQYNNFPIGVYSFRENWHFRWKLKISINKINNFMTMITMMTTMFL